MQAYRWIEDSRDEYTKERLEALDDPFKVRPSASQVVIVRAVRFDRAFDRGVRAAVKCTVLPLRSSFPGALSAP